MAEGLFEGRLNFRRTNLPLAALGGGLSEAAEFLAVGDPAGVDLKAVIAEHPFLDLLGSGGLTQHGRVAHGMSTGDHLQTEGGVRTASRGSLGRGSVA